MNFDILVIIANAALPNLVHFVCHNALFEVNGEFPLPTSENLSFEGITHEAGHAKTWSFSDLKILDETMEEILNSTGPVLVNLRVETGEHHPRDYLTIRSAESGQVFRVAPRLRLGVDASSV